MRVLSANAASLMFVPTGKREATKPSQKSMADIELGGIQPMVKDQGQATLCTKGLPGFMVLDVDGILDLSCHREFLKLPQEWVDSGQFRIGIEVIVDLEAWRSGVLHGSGLIDGVLKHHPRDT